MKSESRNNRRISATISLGLAVADDTTTMLERATEGDEGAAAKLMPLIYDQLRRLARRCFDRRRGGEGLTLQPTALVNEAYLRLIKTEAVGFNSRTHFLAVAATAMRQVLLNHLKHRGRRKRGGGWKRITLSGIAAPKESETAIEALVEALAKFSELDRRATRVVEMRFFAGMTESEVAAALGVSERTVQYDWSMARAWLLRELKRHGEGTDK